MYDVFTKREYCRKQGKNQKLKNGFTDPVFLPMCFAISTQQDVRLAKHCLFLENMP